MKSDIGDLALFGGSPLFLEPKSTSGLVQPNFEEFLNYSRRFFNAAQYSNNGPNVQLLEERLAVFHRSAHCIAFCSGFWGLALTIKALALSGRCEIVIPSLTYRRMADIAAWIGLKPRFCEVDEYSLSLSRETLEPCINDDTALIMAVHPVVNCCNVTEIMDVARAHGVPLVFDGVESVFETVSEGKIGQFGEAECFSIHASKLINGFEGGYVTTNDAALAERLRAMRTFGFTGRDHVSVADGMNAKLCEVHAAMALANLDRLDLTVAENRDRYQVYQQAMPGLACLRLVEFDESHQSSYKNIIMEVTPDCLITRDELLRILNAERILARAYYAPPLHQKAMLYPHIPADLPITDRLAERFISMPCGDLVTTEDIDRVIALLRFISSQGTVIRDRLRKQEVAYRVA
jgi:dTDP-4-amino-4,6-dideoxygalactose transaminase